MSIFKVDKDKDSLGVGAYRLDNDLYAGFKKAVGNTQIHLALEYLVEMMEAIDEKFNIPMVKDSVPDAEEPKAKSVSKTQKIEETIG